MGLSQVIFGVTHQAGYELSMVFCSDQVNGDMKVGDVLWDGNCIGHLS